MISFSFTYLADELDEYTIINIQEDYFLSDIRIAYALENTRLETESEIYTKIINALNELDYYSNSSAPFDTKGKNNFPYLNLYGINNKTGEWVETSNVLYFQLLEAEKYRILTNSNFDYTIGKLIDIWKDVLLTNLQKEVSDEVFLSALDKAMTVMDNYPTTPIEFKIENNKYYIKLANSKVKLDLGAFTKGYACQVVLDILKLYDIQYFSLNFGSSSNYYGKALLSTDGLEPNTFISYIKEPSDPFGLEEPFAAILNIKDIALSSSGDSTQYFLYKGVMYSHIISRYDYMPVSYYHQLTIIGPNPVALDPISTALFSINPNEINQYMELYNVIGIIYDTDSEVDYSSTEGSGYIVSINPNRIVPEVVKDTKDYSIAITFIILTIIIVGIIVVIIINNFIKKNKKYRELYFISALAVLVIGIFLVSTYWPSSIKQKASVYYKNRVDVYATIDFKTNKIEIIKKQDIPLELNPNNKEYPYIEKQDDNRYYLVFLGDYLVDNKYSIFIIEIDFKNDYIKVIQEDSPNHLVSMMGESNSKPLISLPNKIFIWFEK
jgi:thiamine biosynthesis lipoprotein